jgi:hypothetical protein
MQRRHRRLSVAAVALALLAGAQAARAQETDRSVADGGVSVPGWTGRIDARAAEAGQTLDDAKLAPDGDALHVITGPAVTYWNPANTATGSYTVSATFTEPAYMALNDHPHPYGIMIAGNNLGTDQQSYLYCAANGAGNFIVRGFGPAPFQVNGRRGEAHEAVNKATAQGAPVTQEIAVSVRGDKVECAINGTVVGSYDKAALVTDGRLVSTDGVYGLRFAHNTEGIVRELKLTQHD